MRASSAPSHQCELRRRLGTCHEILYVYKHLLGDNLIYPADPADEASIEADRIDGRGTWRFAELMTEIEPAHSAWEAIAGPKE